MNRTLKLLLFSALAVSGLTVIGIFTWELQKGLHYYSWQILPLDEKTGEVKCVGMFGFAWHLWLADNWRCEAVDPMEDTNKFPDILDNPDCNLTSDYFIKCNSPNKILRILMEHQEQ